MFQAIEKKHGLPAGLRRILYIFCVLAILGDTIYSYVQHYNEPLDGDMGESVLPLDYIQPLYHDPFGVKMLIGNEPHAAPNRYFSHRLMYDIYRTMPFALQKITDPISSLYHTNAICKTLMQLLLVLLLSGIACGGFRFRKLRFAITCLFFCAMMQTHGFSNSIGLIFPSITYSFFYALPLIFLVLYLIPFIFNEFYKSDFIRNRCMLILYSALFLVLSCFSGAINPAVSLVVTVTLLMRYFYNFHRQNGSLRKSLARMPGHYYGFLLPLGILSIYSLFLGSFNTMWSDGITLGERYALLPKGFTNMFVSGNGGFGLLFVLTTANCLIIRHISDRKGKTMLSLYHWILLFSAIYIILLPFGGYRPYRPLIIRYDSALPVSCLFIFYYVHSSVFLLEKTFKRAEIGLPYHIWTFSVIIFFFLYDTPRSYRNDMEIAAMREIAMSEKDTVPLTCERTRIVSWEAPSTPEESETAGRLLYLWKVTDKEKLFYFPQE